MPTFKRHHSWMRWAASTVEVAAIVTKGQSLMSELGGKPYLKITVELPGETHEYSSVAEFAEIAPTVEWAKLDSMSIYASHTQWETDTGAIAVYFYTHLPPWRHVARLDITGTRRSWTDGAYAMMTEAIGRHVVKRPALVLTRIWVFLPIMIFLTGAPYGITYEGWKGTAWRIAGDILAILGPIYSLSVCVYWIYGRGHWWPDMRVYLPGHERDRPRVVSAVGSSTKWAVLTVVASVIAFYIGRVLS